MSMLDYRLPKVLPPVHQKVLLNGILVPEMVCVGFESSAGVESGRATFILPRRNYDDYLPIEGAAIEVQIDPVGVVWRGYVVRASWDTGESGMPIVDALDYRSRLQDCIFPYFANFNADGTDSPRVVRTVRQIAEYAWSVYADWSLRTTPNQPLIKFDLSTFPAVVPSQSSVAGVPILDGLMQSIEAVSKRYRIGLRHEADASILYAFMIGRGANKREISRAKNPNLSAATQGANAGVVRREIEASGVVTHVRATGARRRIEHPVTLTPAWDDIDPVLEQLVINNFERFAEPTVTRNEKINPDKQILRNPLFRPGYKHIGCRWEIPAQDDLWVEGEDSFSSYDMAKAVGFTGRQMPVDSNLVQKHPVTGADMSPILVGWMSYPTSSSGVSGASSSSSSELPEEVITDGFSIEGKKQKGYPDPPHERELPAYWVVSDKPLARTLETMLAKGTSLFESSVEPGKVLYGVDAQLTIPYDEFDFGADLWLVVDGVPYKVVDFTVTDPDAPSNSPSSAAFPRFGSITCITQVGTANDSVVSAEWSLLRSAGVYTPILKSGRDSGAVVSNTDASKIYSIPWDGNGFGGMGDLYAGCKLVIAAADGFAEDGPTKVTQKHFDIVGSENVGDKINLTLESSADLSDEAAIKNWWIVSVKDTWLVPWDRLDLQAAFISEQRLLFETGDLGGAQAKRIVQVQNEDFTWGTVEEGCFRPYPIDAQSANSTPGADGGRVNWELVSASDAWDETNEHSGLAAWAGKEVAGMGDRRVSYSVELPLMPLNWRIGDKLVDVAETPCSVTRIAVDLRTCVTSIDAESV